MFLEKEMLKFAISNLLLFYTEKKWKKKDVKDRNILKYETLSMIGYFKIFGDLFHYNIKEMTDIFVTKDEYSLSSIEKKLKLSKLIMWIYIITC